MHKKQTTKAADMPRLELEREINEYLREKDRIRQIVGKVGGVPRKRAKIINVAFLILVAISFAAAICVQDPKVIPLEVAVLLTRLSQKVGHSPSFSNVSA